MNTEKNDTNTGGDYYADDAQVDPGARQGHICCYHFCDTRRATVIVNIVNVLIVFWATLLSGLGYFPRGAFTHHFDPDVELRYTWLPYIFTLFAIGVAYLGITGAKEFTEWKVGVAAGWYCIGALLSLLGLDIIGVICSALFAYPHIVFIQEMRKGIMTEENYPKEEHSCCCV